MHINSMAPWRLLAEAVGRETHADELAELAVRHPGMVHPPTLRVLAHSQRIRAMELRGQAAVLAAGPILPKS